MIDILIYSSIWYVLIGVFCKIIELSITNAFPERQKNGLFWIIFWWPIVFIDGIIEIPEEYTFFKNKFIKNRKTKLQEKLKKTENELELQLQKIRKRRELLSV